MILQRIRGSRWLLVALLASVPLMPQARSQPTLHLPRSFEDDRPEKLNDPQSENNDNSNKKSRSSEQGILPQSYPGGLYPAIAVTLPDVLKLAILANLDLAQANLVVERARVAVL